MKSILTIGLAALLLTGGLTVAGADTPRGERGPRGLDFGTLDRTGDGLLAPDDLEATAEARFAEFDADGNGEVTEAEFITHARAQAGDRAAAMFDRLDSDGDGILSRDVLEARGGRMGAGLERMIERFDADGDGALSAEEFDTARAEMRGNHGGRR